MKGSSDQDIMSITKRFMINATQNNSLVFACFGKVICNGFCWTSFYEYLRTFDNIDIVICHNASKPCFDFSLISHT